MEELSLKDMIYEETRIAVAEWPRRAAEKALLTSIFAARKVPKDIAGMTHHFLKQRFVFAYGRVHGGNGMALDIRDDLGGGTQIWLDGIRAAGSIAGDLFVIIYDGELFMVSVLKLVTPGAGGTSSWLLVSSFSIGKYFQLFRPGPVARDFYVLGWLSQTNLHFQAVFSERVEGVGSRQTINCLLCGSKWRITSPSRIIPSCYSKEELLDPLTPLRHSPTTIQVAGGRTVEVEILGRIAGRPVARSGGPDEISPGRFQYTFYTTRSAGAGRSAEPSPAEPAPDVWVPSDFHTSGASSCMDVANLGEFWI
jgi:hypothetical protein